MTDDQIDYDSLLKNYTIGGLVHGQYRLSQQNQMLVGIQLQRDRMNKKPDIDELWDNHFAITGSLFFQDDYRSLKNTLITLGVGYHFHRTESGNSNGKISPMASLQQLLPNNWRLFSSYSHTYRFPTLHHLYSQASGNPKLLPESAVKFELGVNKTFFFFSQDQYCSVDLALFYNEMTDLIYRAIRSLRYNNVSQATMQGIEVRTNWSLNRYLSGEFSYSYIAFPQSALKINDYIPANKFRIMLTGRTDFGMKLNFEAAYVGERQFFYMSNFVLNLQEYFVLNVNLIQEVTKNIAAWLEASNLLDKYYEEEFGYPQPGRQIMGGIRLSF